MKNLGLYIYTLFNGTFVGKDEKDNKYYKSNIVHGTKKEKRWVLYENNKNNDPTFINPAWHSWLHHVTNDVPNNIKIKKRFYWQKKLSPNQTGTEKAYKPTGHLLNKNKSKDKIKIYESWDPNKNKN